MDIQLCSITLFVLDLDQALQFYVDVLGFAIDTEINLAEDSRIISVFNRKNPALRVLLIPIDDSGIFSKRESSMLKEMISLKPFSVGVFLTKDLDRTCEELRLKGVKILMEPGAGFLGQREAAFMDNSGNWFRLTEDDRGV